jgi:paraquat-inducible protein A
MKRNAAVLALLALLCYGPGILLPALHVEKLGRVRESSLLSGIALLLSDGELFLGLVVGLSALVLPPVKLAAILWLGTAPEGEATSRRSARVLEWIGPFSCLEVFLTAVLVALIRLDALLRFQVLPGLYCFALSALLGLAASVVLNGSSGTLEPSHESCNA